ncbi:MAG: hypothetical protein ABIR55_07760 [Burkholderiaceae bacterium]
MSADTLIRNAMDAGVLLTLEDGKLMAAGQPIAVQAWAPKLREHKAELIAALTEKPLPDWRELDKAYQAHHWRCPTCQAAGRGRSYGLRCGTGAALWNAYSNTSTESNP